MNNDDRPIFPPDFVKAMDAEVEYRKRFEKEKEDAMAEHFEKDQQRWLGGGAASKPVDWSEPIFKKVDPYSIFGIDPEQYERYKKSYGVVYDDPGPPPCVHQPIDVGFAKTKMVCKKCNKDL